MKELNIEQLDKVSGGLEDLNTYCLKFEYIDKVSGKRTWKPITVEAHNLAEAYTLGTQLATEWCEQNNAIFNDIDVES